MAVNYARRYLNAIRDGKVKVSEPVRMVYERLEKEQADKTCKYRFDLKLGNHAIEFIETFCRHYEGDLAGQLVKLDLWQKAFIQTLFGWVDKKTKLRRFREFLLLVARKNGKSMLSACIMVYMLVADGEPGAQCVSIATKYDQAAIVYKTARKIVEQDPELDALVRPHCGRHGVQADEQHHEGPGVQVENTGRPEPALLQLRRAARAGRPEHVRRHEAGHEGQKAADLWQHHDGGLCTGRDLRQHLRVCPVCGKGNRAGRPHAAPALYAGQPGRMDEPGGVGKGKAADCP